MSSLDGEVCILLDPYKHCCKNPCVKKQFKDEPLRNWEDDSKTRK